ncbi:ribosomal protein L7/L12 [uncultured Dokdonia sp.]|uniref:ribosomal protein L7/L12 n=1 Tax=uncultured Dokdonia sp. TaxID=575653 RepID=UPI00260F4D07|nr:ribosomal protein L7/L12 [uncultured Dokdonia sp.]
MSNADMSISINNIRINKTEILSLINSQKKLSAIKRVREQLHVGLKEAKDIVDHLDEDPNYYDGKNHMIDMIPRELFNDSNSIKTSQTVKSHQQKRTPFIERRKTGFKTYIILFLIGCIIILTYLYITK